MRRINFAMTEEVQFTASRIASQNPATGEVLREFECVGEAEVQAAR